MTNILRRAAVLGSPIAHSLSPTLHKAAYEALGLNGWDYGRYEVNEEELEGFLKECDSSWAGLSLTMPLKQVPLRLLDVIEPLAEVAGAVNTVLFQPGGLKVGANTDVYGIVQAIKDVRLDAPANNGVIVGGGATAASAVAALGQLGITNPVILVRSLGRAGTVIRAATAMGVEPTYITLGTDDAQRALSQADILISTIPAGASEKLIESIAPRLDSSNTLLDVVYEGWPTPLPQAWMDRGGNVAPGYDMLLHQAAEQVRLMTGKHAPLEAMRHALLAQLNLGR